MNAQHVFDLAVRQFAQLSIAIVIVGLLTRFVCRRRPELVYVLWMLVLLKSLTPPIWNSPIGIFSWAVSHHIALAPTSDDHTRIAAAIAPMPVHLSSPTLVAGSVPLDRQTWRIALEIWSVGCAGMVLVVVIRRRMLTRRIARLSVPPQPGLAEALEHACRSLRIERRPTLRVCRAAIGPAVMGTLRPTLVIPESIAARNSPAQLRMILMHELLHLRRRDPMVADVQLLSQAIWWFHPLVWWMNRQMTHAREMCCDAQAIVNLRCSPADYAQTLIDILRQRRTFEPLPLAVGIRSAGLTARRLNHIISTSQNSPRQISWRIWIALVACGLSLLPGAGSISRGDATTAPTSQPSQSNAQSTSQANKSLYDFLGQPVAPPAGLNSIYTKEGLTAAMQRAARDANVSLKKLEIDDSEFPYLVGVVTEKGQIDKLNASISKMAGFKYQGSISSDTAKAMNIIPFQAWPQTDRDRIERRLNTRLQMLYYKILTEQ